MEHIHIDEFKKTHTQTQIGEIMGLTQGGVSLAIKAGRDIYFVPLEEGGFNYYEVKKPKKQSA